MVGTSFSSPEDYAALFRGRPNTVVFVIDDPVPPDLRIDGVLSAVGDITSPDITTVYRRRTALGAQDCCVVDYDYKDAQGNLAHTVGVAVARTVPSSSEFFFWDLRKLRGSCKRCSLLLCRPVMLSDARAHHDPSCDSRPAQGRRGREERKNRLQVRFMAGQNVRGPQARRRRSRQAGGSSAARPGRPRQRAAVVAPEPRVAAARPRAAAAGASGRRDTQADVKRIKDIIEHGEDAESDLEALTQFRCDALKDYLRSLGLRVGGNNNKLVESIWELRQEQQGSDADASEESDDM